MKTLKLLLAITIIATSLNTNVQEKQNDATKEECIAFIKKNIRYLNFDDNTFSVEGDKLKVNYKNRPGYDRQMIFSIPLNDISECFGYRNSLRIFCFGKVIKANVPADNYKTTVGELMMGFQTENEKLVKKSTKAFKQLAYLNIQEQENSKF